MHPMLNIAIQAARRASKIIVKFVDRIDTIDVTEKDKNDLVTQVDHMAEAEIINTIRHAYPNHSILSEEAGSLEGDEEFRWIIDPLDGTANFVHGFPQFGVSIALQHKGQLEVGVVYDPLRQELFMATRGEGAQLNNRRIRVAPTKQLDRALIGTGFPFRETHHLKHYLDVFAEMFPQTGGMRRAGAAVLDLAYVAAGRLDGFWEASLKPWDMAAGALLIKEAGGVVSDFQGDDAFLDNGNMVAGNIKMHRALLDIIQKSLHE